VEEGSYRELLAGDAPVWTVLDRLKAFKLILKIPGPWPASAGWLRSRW